MRARPVLERWPRLVAIGTGITIAACNAIAGLDADYRLDSETEGGTPAATPPGSGEAGPVDAGPLPDVAPPCPGRAGPTMARVGSYCIDTTEVTEQQYDEFLQHSVDAGFDATAEEVALPPRCAFKRARTFRPYPTDDPQRACHWDAAALPDHPVVCVDWCDAWAYCRWAGKRLCGAIGRDGGPLAWDEPQEQNSAAHDEWFNACSRGGLRNYPYEAAYTSLRCHDRYDGGVGAKPVASHPGCEGGYEGLFDMVGNAAEWVNACDDAGVECAHRGGGYGEEGPTASCGRSIELSLSLRFEDLGIRCCAE